MRSWLNIHLLYVLVAVAPKIVHDNSFDKCPIQASLTLTKYPIRIYITDLENSIRKVNFSKSTEASLMSSLFDVKTM
jgi:hypothetical protein